MDPIDLFFSFVKTDNSLFALPKSLVLLNDVWWTNQCN